MMASDFFFISAGIAIWISMITTIFVVYKVVKFISKTKTEVSTVKNSLKLAALTLLGKVLGISKGGEDNDNK